jgi:hypothetical protein
MIGCDCHDPIATSFSCPLAADPSRNHRAAFMARSSITSSSAKGAREAHAIASAFDFTWTI